MKVFNYVKKECGCVGKSVVFISGAVGILWGFCGDTVGMLWGFLWGYWGDSVWISGAVGILGGFWGGFAGNCGDFQGCAGVCKSHERGATGGWKS